MKSPCIFQDALERARSATPVSQVCAVLGSRHRRWWGQAVGNVVPSNIFVQPENRGTGYGILLALLHLDAINPDARVIFLPADHHFKDEDSITRTLRLAAYLITANPEVTYLFGTEPESADTELGYIVPVQAARNMTGAVARFAEKPGPDEARALISKGALAQLYAKLKPFDFSREILQHQTAYLRVIRVPPCGWTDLGTPHRVELTVREIASQKSKQNSLPPASPLFLDLGRLACAG
jgi:mannose-1-phosphate guanylyltransferase